MKHLRRVFSMLLVLVMCSTMMLVACGKNDNGGNSGNSGNSGSSSGNGGTTWQPPADEYTIPKEAGHNQITFYWSYPGSVENCDIWVWWDGKEGSGYLLHECEYGMKAVINVPENIEQVGFIVRRDCSDPGGVAWGDATKDYSEDRFASIDGAETFIWLKTGDAAQYTSTDGGKTLIQIKKFTLAGMETEHKIRYNITPKFAISKYSQVKVFEGDKELTILDISSMGNEVVTGTIEVEETLDLSKNYRVEIEGYGSKPVVPTKIFDSKYFADTYHYDGTDLGAVISGSTTTFKVWAPTASKVVLNLFSAGNGGSAYKTVDMVKGDKGVWAHTEACGHGTYYTYTVTTSVGTQEATDPYAKAAGVNGNRSMVVDLARTNPTGWEQDTLKAEPISSYSEAVIWEVHVRDFSNKIASSNYKGKYLAFTETGLKNEHGQAVGVDYLKNLGITHVHLLPVYDYATVDEANPDSQFNWGYDPKNYNVPEGSYSTDPFNGEVRIREFKQMVQALHNAGIGVVMDVVYNHTYDANSSFNRIVPYYYYRYTATGANSSASGCGNDTASERYMYGKFMTESTAYWVDEYNLDGLRFDLMGLHDLETMQNVESAVHTINPNAIIYGEGWTMGSTIDGSAQANQTQISKIKPTGDAIGGIAVFNDVIRDGLKGSVFTTTAQGYINGNPNMLQNVLFGIRGGQGTGSGWTVSNAMVINYMSAHDNNTLWDKLILSAPNASEGERFKMNNLGAAILMISKGTPFWQAGEEMLRTKPTGDGGYDHNSYKSSDAVNNIDWSVLDGESLQYKAMMYYKGLIAMRKGLSIFTTTNTAVYASELGGGAVAITLDNHAGGKALIVINPKSTGITYTLNGTWNLVADSAQAGAECIRTETGAITLDALDIRVYVNDRALANG